MKKVVQSRLKRRRKLYLREWRKYRNLTQEQLAERSGMSQGFISQLEKGITDYSGESLEALAFALQCEPADLIMRNPEDAEAPWSIWETLKPVEKRQAVEILKGLKRASGD